MKVTHHVVVLRDEALEWYRDGEYVGPDDPIADNEPAELLGGEVRSVEWTQWQP